MKEVLRRRDEKEQWVEHVVTLTSAKLLGVQLYSVISVHNANNDWQSGSHAKVEDRVGVGEYAFPRTCVGAILDLIHGRGLAWDRQPYVNDACDG